MGSFSLINTVQAMFLYCLKVSSHVKVHEKTPFLYLRHGKNVWLLISELQYKRSALHSSGIETFLLSKVLVYIITLHIGTREYIIILYYNFFILV